MVGDRDGTGLTESVLEDRFQRVVRPLGLTWMTQVVIDDQDGERIVRVDFRCGEYPDLVVELDGIRWHFSRMAFVRDTRRRSRLTAEGMPALVFTWDDVAHRPDDVRGVLRRRIAWLGG